MQFRHYDAIKISRSGGYGLVSNTGFPFPFILSDISYDKINPNIKTNYETGYSSGSSYRFAESCFIVNPIDNTNVYIKESSSAYYYGYPYMVSGTSLGADSASTAIPSAFISGKYKFRTSVGWGNFYGTLGESTINVDVDINGIKVKAVILSGLTGNRTWYYYNDNRKFLSVITPTTLAIGTYSIYNHPTQAPTDLNFSYVKLNTFELNDTYKNMIWDFGSIPQEVPESFKNWVELNAEYIYPNSFTVKNSTGIETLATLIEAPAMLKGTVTYVGKSKTLNLLGSNGKTYTLNWESDTPPNKIFSGLAFKPNHTVANIPVGTEVDFNLEGDITFYECYQPYKPPVETFSVTLYKNSAEANRVDKTNYLQAVDTINGVLRTSTSITTLEIAIEHSTLPQFNYCYIPAFNRYYFVDDISSLRFGLWKLNLSVDPLMTYKDAILSCFAFVDRNEFEFNDNIIDKKMVVEQGVDVDVVEFGNDILSTNNQFYKYCITGYKIGVGTQA